jgi:hypothetical protein
MFAAIATMPFETDMNGWIVSRVYGRPSAVTPAARSATGWPPR